jgi:microcystin-dependent protein
MTVNILNTKNTYTGNGTKRIWGYDFDFNENFNSDYIEIYVSYLNDTPIKITSNFTIDKVNKQITYPTIISGLPALSSYYTIVICRNTPKTQPTSYTNQGIFPANAIEKSLDNIVLRLQEVGEEVNRAYKKDIAVEKGRLDDILSITFEDGSTINTAGGGSAENISNNNDVVLNMNANNEAINPRILINNNNITKSYIDENGNFFGNVNGNADTSTTLKTPRNIAGKSFNGSADITIASTDLSDSFNIARLDTASFLPVGGILMWMNRNLPTGFFWMDGAAKSRTNYPSLFNYCCPLIGTFTITIATPAVLTLTSHGCLTGDQIYLTTTGALPTGLTANTLYYVIYVDANTIRLATSRANAISGTAINTSGTQSGAHSLYDCPNGLGDGSTTFNLPDMRESTPVGIGTRGSGITAHDTFNLGQFKDDQMQGHYHSFQGYSTGTGTSENALIGNNNSTIITAAGVTGVRGLTSDGTNGTPRTGTTTRGKAFGVNFIIKY